MIFALVLKIGLLSAITAVYAISYAIPLKIPSNTYWDYPDKMKCRSGPGYIDHIYNGDFLKSQLIEHQKEVFELDRNAVPAVTGSNLVPVLVPGEKAWRFDMTYKGLETVSMVWIERAESPADPHPEMHNKFLQLFSAWVTDHTSEEPGTTWVCV